jgi:hypothetical protein
VNPRVVVAIFVVCQLGAIAGMLQSYAWFHFVDEADPWVGIEYLATAADDAWTGAIVALVITAIYWAYVKAQQLPQARRDRRQCKRTFTR